jgi:RNA polymerase sigma factor (sigma-70 family)
LSPADQDEVAQRTWAQLVTNIGRIREPDALGGWLATTARYECLRIFEASSREIPVDEPVAADQASTEALDDALAAEERRAALHRALDVVPPSERTIVRMLLAHPAMSYEQLGSTLGVPIGSIGPTRGRCIAQLRRDPHLAGVVGVSDS